MARKGSAPKRSTIGRRKTTTPKRKLGLGLRGERLAGDGQTFTSLTALPRQISSPPLEYSMYQTTTTKNWLTTSATLPVHTSLNVEFAEINENVALGAIFDQYMIDAVEVWIVPNQTTAGNGGYTGLLYSVIDLDDDTVLTSLTSYGDYANCIVTQMGQGHYRHFVPHIAMSAYQGTFSAYANRKFQWLDANSPNVAHYGIKVGVDFTSTSMSYDLIVKIHVNFRSVR